MSSENTKVNVGDMISNNDPRNKGDTFVIKAVVSTGPGDHQCWAKYQSKKRWASVRFDRIFTDGQTRAVGYNLVK